MNDTERLCQHLSDVTIDEIPDDAIVEAKRMMIDTIGVSIAALDEEASQIVIDACSPVSEETDTARVWGDGTVGTPTDIALANGVMGHALDFDDIHGRIGGHPSVPVLPAVLALGESLGKSGEDVLKSFVLGAEVQTVLGDVMNPGHFDQGWHPTAVLGHVGAAVSAGVLLEQTSDELARTIGLVSSAAGGIKGNFGTMTKPFHAGNAARNGLEAARLVSDGFTASGTILEDGFGFCALFQGTPGYDFKDRLDHLDSLWGVINPPPGFKQYPCCAGTHAAVDAAREIHARYDIDTSEIAEIKYVTQPRRLPTTDNPSPSTPLEGKFSVQYVMSVALERGDVWFDDFTPEAINDRGIRDLMSKIEVVGDATVSKRANEVENANNPDWGEYDLRFTEVLPSTKQAYVQVTTEGGDQYESYVSPPEGTPPNRMTNDDLYAKYRRCTEKTLSDDEIEMSISMINDLEEEENISNLLDVLTPTGLITSTG